MTSWWTIFHTEFTKKMCSREWRRKSNTGLGFLRHFQTRFLSFQGRGSQRTFQNVSTQFQMQRMDNTACNTNSAASLCTQLIRLRDIAFRSICCTNRTPHQAICPAKTFASAFIKWCIEVIEACYVLVSVSCSISDGTASPRAQHLWFNGR